MGSAPDDVHCCCWSITIQRIPIVRISIVICGPFVSEREEASHSRAVASLSEEFEGSFVDLPCWLGVTLRSYRRLHTFRLHLHYITLQHSHSILSLYRSGCLSPPSCWQHIHSHPLSSLLSAALSLPLWLTLMQVLWFSLCLLPIPIFLPVPLSPSASPPLSLSLTHTGRVLLLTVSMATGWAKQLSSTLAVRQCLSSTPSPTLLLLLHPWHQSTVCSFLLKCSFIFQDTNP